MRLARYVGNGKVEIVIEPTPVVPAGGLLIQTKACGLCSGELMDWYMEKKLPHVLGHEASGIVVGSDDPRFPIGTKVVPHHHAPCLKCRWCVEGRYVHCEQWKRTRFVPGGMAEFFSVSAENLNDCYEASSIDYTESALAEPVATVIKAIRRSEVSESANGANCAVIGLGVMGLIHMKLLGTLAVGIEKNQSRLDFAKRRGDSAISPIELEKNSFETVFICPGSPEAVSLGLSIVKPGGKVILFAPFTPGVDTGGLINEAYFKDVMIVPSYSAGPNDMRKAISSIQERIVQSADVISDWISLDQLPEYYLKMKEGKILKPMVLF